MASCWCPAQGARSSRSASTCRSRRIRKASLIPSPGANCSIRSARFIKRHKQQLSSTLATRRNRHGQGQRHRMVDGCASARRRARYFAQNAIKAQEIGSTCGRDKPSVIPGHEDFVTATLNNMLGVQVKDTRSTVSSWATCHPNYATCCRLAIRSVSFNSLCQGILPRAQPSLRRAALSARDGQHARGSTSAPRVTVIRTGRLPPDHTAAVPLPQCHRAGQGWTPDRSRGNLVGLAWHATTEEFLNTPRPCWPRPGPLPISRRRRVRASWRTNSSSCAIWRRSSTPWPSNNPQNLSRPTNASAPSWIASASRWCIPCCRWICLACTFCCRSEPCLCR